MSKEKQYRSPIAIPPGETLEELLKDRSMTQADLAKRTDMTPKHINEVIAGKASISSDMALRLESVLGIPASFWNNLEANYQEARARLADETQIQEEICYLTEISYAEIAKYCWTKQTRNKTEQVMELRKFFGVASLNLVPTMQPAAFRKANFREASSFALATWLRQGEREAASVKTQPFNRNLLKQRVSELRALCRDGVHPQHAPLRELLLECGVATVFVPWLKHTYVTGATRWLTPEKVMVEMSFRGKWADIFWFSLFHELGHVLLQHSKKETFIGVEYQHRGNFSEEEQEADLFAKEELIPEREFWKFKKHALFSPDSVRQFANQLSIHPGIVAGRLEFEELVPHGQLNELRHQYELAPVQRLADVGELVLVGKGRSAYYRKK